MKTRTTVLAISIALFLSGCATAIDREESGELLAHQIVIPKVYRWGAVNPNFTSSAERYLYAYDGAWWACIRDFAANINYQPTQRDHAGNGWPAAVDGYSDGYSAAETKVKEIRQRFGDRKAQELLQQALENPK